MRLNFMVWIFILIESISIQPVSKPWDPNFQVRRDTRSVTGLRTVNACPYVLASPSSRPPSLGLGLVSFLTVLNRVPPALSPVPRQLALPLVLETRDNQDLKAQTFLLGIKSSNGTALIFLPLYVSLNPTFWVTNHRMLRNGPWSFK